MVKQTKKGSIGKKALSAILAASMIMTSSSFVMADPVVEEVEAVAVEEVAVDEENASVENTKFTVGNGEFSQTETVADDVKKAILAAEAPNAEGKLLDIETYIKNGYWTVTLNDKVLTSVDFECPTKLGTYTLVVSHNENGYKSTATYKIVQGVATKALVDIEDQVYNGSEIEAPVVVTIDGEELKIDEDYELKYSNNVNAGSDAEVTVTFKGDYVNLDPITKKFSIEKADLSNDELRVAVDAKEDQTFEYTGEVILPEVDKVTARLVEGYSKTTELVAGTDYEISLTEDGTDADEDAGVKVGKHTAYVIGKGNFKGVAATITYEIVAKTFSNATVSVEAKNVPSGVKLTNTNIGKYIIVTDKETGEVVDPSQYKVEYEKDGKYYDFGTKPLTTSSYDTFDVRISAVPGGNYESSKTSPYIYSSFTVVGQSLNTLEVKEMTGTGIKNPDTTSKEYYFVYNGDEDGQLPASVTMTEGGAVTPEEPNNGLFTATFPSAESCVDAGTYEITLTGNANNKYAGQTAVIKFAIAPKTILASDFSVGYDRTHTGDAAEPYAIVKDGDKLLVEGTDYTKTVDTTKKSITITGIGNYKTGTKGLTKTYNSTPAEQTNLNNPTIQVELLKEYTYTGYKITPAAADFVVKEVGASGTYTLQNANDYTFKAIGDWVNTGSGKAQIAITGKNGFTGTRIVDCKIVGPEVSTLYKLDTSDLESNEVAYSGESLTTEINALLADIDVRKLSNNAIANSSIDAIKFYRDGKETTDFKSLGTITVEYTLKNCEGVLSTTVVVVGNPLSDVAIFGKIADQQYTGKEITPVVPITAKDNAALKEGRDYEVSYQNNIKVGEARAIVKGIGNYDGEYVINFNIVGEMTQEISVLPAQEKALKSRTLNDKATKVKFTKDLETAVTYTSSDEDVVTVDAEGNIKYTGLGEATITIKTAAENGYKEAVKELKVVVGLKQPTFSPSSKNNAFTVTTSTVKGAEKFQVQYVPTGKSFTSKAAKSKTFTVDKKLVKGKISAANKETYRVRVRAINGDTKSKWSPVKTIATK